MVEFGEGTVPYLFDPPIGRLGSNRGRTIVPRHTIRTKLINDRTQCEFIASSFDLSDQYEEMNAQIEPTAVAKREYFVSVAICSHFGALLAGLVISASITSVPACAQTATQRFVVRVPTKTVVITPPAALVTDVESDSAEFPEQKWTLESNSITGLVAEFSVNAPFSNAKNPAVSDAELALNVSPLTGEGQWAITQSSDATAYRLGKRNASVKVISDAKGSAEVGLRVFLLQDADSMQNGSYTTTVYCTLATP